MKETGILPLGEPVASIQPAARPAAITHSGEAVRLRAIEPATDAPTLFEASHGPENEWIWTYMPYGPFASVEQMQQWLGEISASEDPRFFTVCTTSDDSPVGVVSYLAIEPAHRSIEVGHIWYVPEVQRTVVNTQSLFLLLRHAFDDLGYRRVEWKCDALNARSRAAARRLGFQPEGIFRQHRIVRGRNRDTAWFSILDFEWPELRKKYETWLAAPNGARPSLSQLTASSREDS